MEKNSRGLTEKKVALYLLSQKGIGLQTVRSFLLHLQNKRIKPEDFRLATASFKSKKIVINKIATLVKNEDIDDYVCSFNTQLKASGTSVVYYTDKQYPRLLKKTQSPPLFLFYRGNLGVLSKECVAVVGARKCTPYGTMVTKKIVNELVADDYCIVSGCMYGVDEVAHREAVRRGGATVAVLGYGRLHPYPQRMESLLTYIETHDGLVIGEYPPDTEPLPGFFLARNRVIAGLSRAVVVTEAAQKSGSHTTALSAAEQGRSVFALPGPITNPYSDGTKWLVNQGATLVSSGFEISTYLGKTTQVQKSSEQNETQNQIQDAVSVPVGAQIETMLASGPTTTESLVQHTGRDIHTVLAQLLKMELDGTLVKDGILWYLNK